MIAAGSASAHGQATASATGRSRRFDSAAAHGSAHVSNPHTWLMTHASAPARAVCVAAAVTNPLAADPTDRPLYRPYRARFAQLPFGNRQMARVAV